MSTKKKNRNSYKKSKKNSFKIPYIWIIIIVISFSLIYASWHGKKNENSQSTDFQYKTTIVNIQKSLSDKSIQFNVEIADTPDLTSLGLMNREYLAEDAGMLFVFPYPDKRSFWMKNTIIPLDIIFIDGSGKIIQISETTTPYSTESIVCLKPAQYVLEVNAGITEQHKINIGDIITWDKY